MLPHGGRTSQQCHSAPCAPRPLQASIWPQGTPLMASSSHSTTTKSPLGGTRATKHLECWLHQLWCPHKPAVPLAPCAPRPLQASIWPCSTHETAVRKHQSIWGPLLATTGANKHLLLCQRLSWCSQEPGITTALSAHATHHSLRIQRVLLETSRSRAERSLFRSKRNLYPCLGQR